jgi:hypothetical protein
MTAARITAPIVISATLLAFPAAAHAQEEAREKAAQEPEHARVGALAGVGFPRPLSFEAMVKLERIVGIGLEYGLMPAITTYGVHTTFNALAADLRVFPLRGAFFLGLRAGRQSLATDIVEPTYAAIEVDSWFINPRIGLLYTWSFGLSIGVEAGLQIPVSSSTTTSRSFPLDIPIVDSMSRVTNALGAGLLPTVDLLRVGFLF